MIVWRGSKTLQASLNLLRRKSDFVIFTLKTPQLILFYVTHSRANGTLIILVGISLCHRWAQSVFLVGIEFLHVKNIGRDKVPIPSCCQWYINLFLHTPFQNSKRWLGKIQLIFLHFRIVCSEFRFNVFWRSVNFDVILVSPIRPKNELENSNFFLSLLTQKFFVRFLGELKKTKCPFEINWPLVTSTIYHLATGKE